MLTAQEICRKTWLFPHEGLRHKACESSASIVLTEKRYARNHFDRGHDSAADRCSALGLMVDRRFISAKAKLNRVHGSTKKNITGNGPEGAGLGNREVLYAFSSTRSDPCGQVVLARRDPCLAAAGRSRNQTSEYLAQSHFARVNPHPLWAKAVRENSRNLRQLQL